MQKGKKFANKNLSFVLGLFKNCNYVITDSFHATVLSIIFKKNFFIALPEQTGMRLTEFLSLINLEDRIVKDVNSLKNKKHIDFTKIECCLSDLRRKQELELNDLWEMINNI